MAQQTAQSVTATPGRVHSFVAKAAASVVVLGPYFVAARDAHVPGAVASDSFAAGAATSDSFVPGVATSEAK